MDEPAVIVCEVAVVVGGLGFQLVFAERMAAERCIGESESHNNSAF